MLHGEVSEIYTHNLYMDYMIKKIKKFQTFKPLLK